MNAPLTTNANSGTPIALPSELRKRAHDAANGTADMVPEDWRGLVGGLLKFFKEEAAEPEHAGDIEPKTLYASRPLKNGDAVMAWARKAGFKKTLPAADMHVTVAFSKTPLAWPEPDRGGVIAPDANGDLNGTRSIEHLGDQGAIVLRFEAPALAARWQQLRDAGASWDYDDFRPHVTFTMDAGAVDLAAVEPYAGELVFGPEEFKEIGTRAADWADKARASMVGADAEIDGVNIDREHDGPWMSCMSTDGTTMYVNKNLPRQAEIDGKMVDVAAILLHHELPEWRKLEELKAVGG